MFHYQNGHGLRTVAEKAIEFILENNVFYGAKISLLIYATVL